MMDRPTVLLWALALLIIGAVAEHVVAYLFHVATIPVP